ncbi:hypothetical protein FHX34_1013 [Actinoplanes teichomyceticus]|uniref:Uncharacterized protein n=1 Tax=Actinoplanes teichomyceticus TaxID=1867 RepID=A0A561WMF5_ACTTI|nr:hypothetical protein FHX34_1013 [Actinoplanes teichomyceticus]
MTAPDHAARRPAERARSPIGQVTGRLRATLGEAARP